MVVLAALAELPARAGAPAAANVDAARPAGMLHVAGGWLRDAFGRVVILHGVNLVWKDAPYVAPNTALGLTDADAALMSSLGFNVVRLGLTWKGYEPARGVYDEHYLDRLVADARILARHGLYVLLDSHQDSFNERFDGGGIHGEGFPDWAVYTDGLPSVPSITGDNRQTDPALNRAWDNVWADRGSLWEEYARMWRRVATRFASERGILGYDLLNEPWAGHQWPTCSAFPTGCPLFYRQFLQPFEDASAAAIRSVDRDHLVVYEPDDVASSGTHSWLTAPTPAGTNVIYSFHVYCAFHPPVADAAFCDTSEAFAVNASVSNAARLHAAPLMSEFGASADLVSTARGVALADKAKVGWIYWEYKASAETLGAQNSPGGRDQSMFDNDANLSTLRKAKADILSEPYPVALAGIPLSYGFDAAHEVFSLTYAPDASIAAPSVVFAGPRHYPHGYGAEVQGAHITSPPCAPYVTLRALPGARQVTLKLRPGNCRPAVARPST
jgi:endoglycosylceramidase